MGQIAGVIFTVVAMCIMTFISYKMTCLNEGRNQKWHTIWWWSTGAYAVLVMVAIIFAGVIIQRIYF